MRVIILDTVYGAFLDAHYAADSGLGRRPYSEQWHSIMGAGFGTSDAYSHFLAASGHDAHEIIANCVPLQAAWAAEHGMRTRWSLLRGGRRRLFDTVLAQVDDYDPDVVYVQDLRAFEPRELRAFRGPGRLLVAQLGTEPPDEGTLRSFDLITTCLPQFVPWLRGLGIDAELFRIGFDSRMLERVEIGEREGVVFVGSLLRPRWEEAIDRIAAAAEDVEIDFYGYGAETWPEESPVRRRYRGEAWGMDMCRVLARSQIALNRHGDVAGDFATNMRLYEATGMGALLVTDDKRNLGDLFEVGGEVVAYRSSDELVAKIRYFRQHDDERESIAAAGQRRTLAEHSYAVRMQELAAILSARLG